MEEILQQIEEKIDYLEKCLNTIENIDANGPEAPLAKVIEAQMDDTKREIIELLDSLEDSNTDGGPGSGNWGHVGVLGVRGGSAPGGGLGFRSVDNRKKAKPYTSQAKERDSVNNNLKKFAPDKQGNFKNKTQQQMYDQAVRKSQKINMGKKTARAINTLDPNASKNAIADGLTKKGGYTGTKHGVKVQTNAKGNEKGFQYGTQQNSTPPDTKNNSNPAPKVKKAPRTPKTPNTPPQQNATNPTPTPAQNNNANQSNTQSNQQNAQNNGQDYKTTQRPTNQTYVDLQNAKTDAEKQQIIQNAIKGKQLSTTDPTFHSQSRNHNKNQVLVNELGLDGKATVVDSATFDKIASANKSPYGVIYRGAAKNKLPEAVDTDYNKMGGLAYA